MFYIYHVFSTKVDAGWASIHRINRLAPLKPSLVALGASSDCNFGKNFDTTLFALSQKLVPSMTRWERENCQTLLPPLLYRYFIYYYYLLVDIVVLNAFDFESPFTTYNKLPKIQGQKKSILSSQIEYVL